MFTEAVYIRKPSDEIINSLKKMGYRFVHSQKTNTQEPQEYLFVQLGKISYETRNWCRHVDFAKYCDKNNEKLFLELAAMRDDTDKDQWFISNIGEWYINRYDKFRDDIVQWICSMDSKEWRRATAKEIIERFKK